MSERQQAAAPASEVEARALHLLQWVVRGGHGRDPRQRLVEGLRSLDGVFGAWLGAPDQLGRVVAHTVSHEPIRAYMDAVTIRIDATPQGMGPVGRAWRSGRVEWVDDWRSDPSGSPWSAAVTALGVRSSAAIVLRGRSGTREILNVYSDREAWFSSPRWRALIEYITSLFGVILEEFDLRQRLEQQAQLDPLTRLPNRRALEIHLERTQAHAARNSRPFGIALIDLDGFKAVNDTYGHEVGDQLLEHVARRMKAVVRREDFLSRQGGDEFVVVLDGLASPREVSPLLERLRQAIATPLSLPSGVDVVIGASAGVALWNGMGDAPSVWDLLRRSDAALYRMKGARLTRPRWWSLYEAQDLEATCRDDSPPGPYGLWAEQTLRAAGALLAAARRAYLEAHESAAGDWTAMGAAQVQHMALVARPGLTARRHANAAIRLGRLCALNGAGSEWISDQHDRYEKALLAASAGQPARFQAVLPVMLLRLSEDRRWQFEGAGALARDRAQFLERLTERACEATDAQALAAQVVDAFAAGLDGVDTAVVVRSAAAGDDVVAAIAAPPSHPAHGVAVCGWKALAASIEQMGSSRQVTGVATVSQTGDADIVKALPDVAASLTERHIPVTLVKCTVVGRAAEWTLLLVGVHGHLLAGGGGDDCLLQACRMLSLSWRHLPDHGVAAGRPRPQPRVVLHDGRLQMHFQPIVDLRTNRPVKVEALARVRENGRLLGPELFLPQLDGDGLFALYRTGLKQALEAVRGWADKGCVLNLAVNLPARGFVDRRYLDATAQALRQFPLPKGASLFLELLETDRVDLSDASAVAARFAPWQSLGVRFVEDDLGAGYSSLLRLSRAPFEAVKVEQQLVRAQGGQVDRPAIVRALVFIAAITHLAHVLGLRVCVEGLETAAMIEGARAVGADFGQGFGIAEPMPANRVLPWVRRHPIAPAIPEESLKAELEAVYRALHDSATRAGVNSGDHAAAYRQLYGLYAERILRRLAADPVVSEARY